MVEVAENQWPKINYRIGGVSWRGQCAMYTLNDRGSGLYIYMFGYCRMPNLLVYL